MDVLIEVFAPQKTQREQQNNVHDLKSLLLSLNNPCSFKCLESVAVMVCVLLQPFLFFIFFTLA